MARYDLSEIEWRLIAALLPNKSRGVARVDDFSTYFGPARRGSICRAATAPYTTVYNLYNR